jgi:hypothetical protein
MRSIRVPALAIIGLLLGLGWFQLETSGYFERWELLVNPSAEVLSAFSQRNFPDEYGNPRTCDFSSPEFSFLINAPEDIADCVQRLDMAADANTRTVYVIDNHGEIWIWRYFSYAYDYYAKRIIFPSVGIVFGLLIGLLSKRRVPHRQQFSV